MKQPLSLEVLSTHALNTIGSSSTHVTSARRVYVVGGKLSDVIATDDNHKKEAHSHSPYLSIQSFDLSTMDFTKILVNANGQYNVAFHTTVAVGKDILMIGGRLLKSHIEPQLNGSLIRIRDSDFGVGCKGVLEDSQQLARQGHCAHTLTGLQDTVLVFGGFSYADPSAKDYSKVYRSDVCVVEKMQVSVDSTSEQGSERRTAGGDSWTAAAIETTGTPPQGRAYFSSCLLASDSGSNLLLVHGGKTGSAESGSVSLLDDFWVLEVTKGELGWKALWSPLVADEGSVHIRSLQCHNMFAQSALAGGAVKVCLYGGFDEIYAPHDEFYELSIVRNDDGSAFAYSASLKDTNNNLGDGGGAFFSFGASIVPVSDSGTLGSTSCVLQFGGLRDVGHIYANGTKSKADDATLHHDIEGAAACLMIAIDNSSEIVNNARKCLRERRADGDLMESSVASQLQLYERIRLADGSSYEGETIEDADGSKILHGAGKLTKLNGSLYEGIFVNNLMEGEGKHSNAESGLLYEGAFVHSIYCGKGRLTKASGEVLYVGDFDGGLYHGLGTLHSMQDEEGGLYEGGFKGGFKSGEGRISYSNKATIMNGTFNKDVMVAGLGTAVEVENDNRSPADKSKVPRLFKGTYSGHMKHCKPHGQGKAVWEDGSSYEGGFINGTRGGLGNMCYSDGGVYEGKMKGDLRCGGGRWVSAAGNESYSGQWLDGEIDGLGVYHYSDGGVYDGIFKKGMKNQSGRYTRAVGSVRKGSGELVSYEGSYYNDQRHGHGTAELADGTTRSGLFEFDEFVA